jgi:hypothetical protein
MSYIGDWTPDDYLQHHLENDAQEVDHAIGCEHANTKPDSTLPTHPAICTDCGVRLLAKSIVTTAKYWDCECDESYIKPKGQPHCPDCGTWHYDQPDSRENEVVKAGLPLVGTVGTCRNCHKVADSITVDDDGYPWDGSPRRWSSYH